MRGLASGNDLSSTNRSLRPVLSRCPEKADLSRSRLTGAVSGDRGASGTGVAAGAAPPPVRSALGDAGIAAAPPAADSFAPASDDSSFSSDDSFFSTGGGPAMGVTGVISVTSVAFASFPAATAGAAAASLITAATDVLSSTTGRGHSVTLHHCIFSARARTQHVEEINL